MKQYQAGYILEAVRENLLFFAKKNDRELELNGLLRSLSTFNIQTNINLENTFFTKSIFAVATNILTRGLPTLANISTEHLFTKSLNKTHRVDLNEKGKITFPFNNDSNSNNDNSFFLALHTIDPRAKNRINYLDISNTDSDFERNFLFQLIPANNSFIAQLLEKQRPRNSFTRDNNQGRVDFSLEIPYDIKRDRLNRFNAKVNTKHHIIIDREDFDRAFEDVFKERTKEEKEEIQRRYGTMQAYLENMDRLRKIAEDLVNHYIDEILPNGYKAMVVSSSVLAAARYEYLIQQAINNRLELEKNKPERDEELILQIEFIKAATIVTQQDNNEEAFISAARKKAKEMNAVENFKKDFDYTVDENGCYQKPETGIAFLCVCDRLLTGFDAPIAQVMYLDKSIREHDLLQAIARVNRTKGEKEYGILVDYYGVSNHLKDALNIWGAEDEKDIQELLDYFRDINKEIPVLEARYNRMIQLFEDKGIRNFRAFAEQTMTDNEAEFKLAEQCIELAEAIPFRAQFDTYLKAFFDSLDLLFNTEKAKQYYIPAKRFGYLLIRIRNRYKDPTMDLKWAKPKVRKIIDKYLETVGINSKIPPVSLLSDDFQKEINKSGSTKSKASEMEHAIRRHIKVNMDKDPALYTRFIERMNQIMERYKGNWEQIFDEYKKLKDEIEIGRKDDSEFGLDKQELPFYDLIVMNSYGDEKPNEEDNKIIIEIVIELIDKLQEAISKPNFWKERDAEIRRLQGEIDDILDFSGIEILSSSKERLSIEIMNLAKRRHQELTK